MLSISARNVLVGHDGRVRVTDFGLAERAAPGIAGECESRRQLAGTPFIWCLSSPASEPVDARTDQFGFCVAIYATLTRKHPLRRDGTITRRPQRDRVPGWLWRRLRRGIGQTRCWTATRATDVSSDQPGQILVIEKRTVEAKRSRFAAPPVAHDVLRGTHAFHHDASTRI